jgi:hypothetical protein
MRSREKQRQRQAKYELGPISRAVSRPRSAATLALTAVIVLGALASTPGAASAAPARYVFEMCDSALPAGGTGGVRFAPTPNQPWAATNTCDQPGGSLEIAQVGNLDPGGYGIWALPIEPPPGGSMESVTVTGYSCRQPNTVAYIVESGWPLGICQQEIRTFRVANSFRGFEVILQCNGSCWAGSVIRAQYFAVTQVDPVAPRLTEVSGSLFDGNVKRGRQSVSAKAHDVGGGLSAISLWVNGQLLASKPFTCAAVQTANPSVYGTVASQIVPCPVDAGASWSVDTGAFQFRNGANSVQVCASDFATLGDPNFTCSPAQTVNVDNSCAESAVAGGDALSAEFDQSKAETVTVGYGEPAAVTGQLSSNAGDPVPGATLCVKAATIGIDQKANAVGLVKTDANGRFSYEVAPGPNREVVIGYRHDASQVARQVRYYSRTLPSLSGAPTKLRNGKRVWLTGQLPAPNNSGRVVVLQANIVGSKRWITFRRASTGPLGGFRSSYHFTSTTRPTTYRFRAVAPTQAGYPWIEGTSKPVAVRVKPKRR